MIIAADTKKIPPQKKKKSQAAEVGKRIKSQSRP